MTTLSVWMVIVTGAGAAPYPFEGSWVRADRSCAVSVVRERVYTPKDVTSSRGRCTIHKVAAGSGAFEIFERCERPNERPSQVSEIIRLTGPDSMVVIRKTARLKLSRSLRYTRCPSLSFAPKPPGH